MSERHLIVNADDLGASPGINRGVIEAHERGIVTSASLMVDMPAAEAAAAAVKDLPGLGVGLHVVLTHEHGELRIDPRDCPRELERQLSRFHALIGGPPTHLDSHHHIHRDTRLAPHFTELAKRHRLPLREHSAVRYHGSFYGQWDGVTHLEQVSIESLTSILRELKGGASEIGCHPGYMDGTFSSSYALEREEEVRTLCHPRLREELERLDLRLCSFASLPRDELGSTP